MEFDDLFAKDQALRKLLGEFPDKISMSEKKSILKAYQSGGGVQGLDLEEKDSEEDLEGGE